MYAQESRQNFIKRLVLTANSDDCSAGTPQCETHCNDNRVQGTYIPIGRAVDSPSSGVQPGSLIYAKSGLDSLGKQWYFVKLTSGNWEFTWDAWVPTSDIDYDDVATGRLNFQQSQSN